MIVLGIETSCDETAAAVVADDGAHGHGRILAEAILSQEAQHQPYGGVVPEVAARSHLDHIDRLVTETLARANVGLDAIDGVAAAAGPGLIGGVMVGVMTAKAIAAARGRPFLAINHLEAHALSARLGADVPFPYLLLLVSGGHCQLLIVEGVGRYVRLGTTVDDAAGEAFDKAAKLLGLGYPGGPALEQAARAGDPSRFPLPRPMKGRSGCDFSFSGLKTALAQTVARLGALSGDQVADLAAAFQSAVGDVLIDRTRNALKEFQSRHGTGGRLVAAGGVAANQALRARLAALAAEHAVGLVIPSPRLCTDNGAMIAWAGIERLRLGLVDRLNFAPRPRWPLDPKAPPAVGAGVKA